MPETEVRVAEKHLYSLWLQNIFLNICYCKYSSEEPKLIQVDNRCATQCLLYNSPNAGTHPWSRRPGPKLFFALRELHDIPPHNRGPSLCLRLQKAGQTDLTFFPVISLVSESGAESDPIPGFGFFPRMVSLNPPMLQGT